MAGRHFGGEDGGGGGYREGGERGAPAFVFEEPDVGQEDEGEDQGRSFGEIGGEGGDQVPAVFAVLGPGDEAEQAGDHAQGRVDLGALDDVVEGFGVGGMEAVAGGGGQGRPGVYQAAEEEEHQDELEQEPEEGREVEPEGLVAVREAVIEGQRGGDQGAVHGVIGEGAGEHRVGEKAGDVAELFEEEVAGDAVEIVEVEVVVEVVGVGGQNDEEQAGERGEQEAGFHAPPRCFKARARSRFFLAISKSGLRRRASVAARMPSSQRWSAM